MKFRQQCLCGHAFLCRIMQWCRLLQTTAMPVKKLSLASIQGILYMADSAHRSISHVVGQQLKQLFPSRVTGKTACMCYRVRRSRTAATAASTPQLSLSSGHREPWPVMCTSTTRPCVQVLLQCIEAEALRPFPSSVVRRRGRKKQPVLQVVT